MRTKTLVVVVVLAVAGAVFLWWRETGGVGGLGCYTAPVAAGILPDTGAVQAVGCDEPHDYEAIAILTEAGADERCREQAESFLGGPWEQSRTDYGLLRDKDPMRGRLLCAVTETAGTGGRPVGSTRSMKDGMRGDRRLAITCLVTDTDTSTDGDDEEQEYLFGECAQSHAAEFVGTVAAGGDTDAACGEVAAAYLGLPDLRQRADLRVAWLSRENELCLVTEVPDPAGRHDTLRGSVQGLGAGPLPR
ncbi:septum formation family protein [Dactylosporangium sp. NPDC049742]|uniref:septum formation family protein n=1 Tax=Dactylosporangium sp. NPDC049742 TaxID=3154737 RepID=UPI0034368E6B